MTSDNIAYSFVFWGVTLTVTLNGIMSFIGLLIGIAGVVIGFQRNRQIKRANDLKERELENAEAKNRSPEKVSEQEE